MPAWELPYWQAEYSREPWGFSALDYLTGKLAHQLIAATGRLQPGTTIADLCCQDPFECGELSEEEYAQLDGDEQIAYSRRLVARTKQVLS
ncbi:hypothetical protein FKG94_03100 [Exilibacterium tricleocarpae]|uniref:Uncharacterized protein n=1 Tax=Exilibacterium tricleocarpae TaxID=2591008 RepID=A0A545U6T4_9GAMM|nr:hypothetical protein [Exilibacterium tricleocarpae]TQV85191.1 hypothetical protein FKG94_03100 [Exilibacterium tricleocarpae]